MDVGTGIIFAVAAVLLLAINATAGTSRYSLDAHLERRIAWWPVVAEVGGRRRNPLSQSHMAAGIAHQEHAVPGMAVGAGAAVVLFFFALFIAQAVHRQPAATASVTPPATTSGMNMNSGAIPTPGNGGTTAPVKPLPGAIPPVEVRHGTEVDLTLVAMPATVNLRSGETYNAWSFDGQVPGPVIRLQQGDTVHVTFINRDPSMSHSLDLHAAQTAPSVSFAEVAPGKSITWTFTASVPGVFDYHCGTPPMVEHIANGMFGTVIVDPTGGRTAAQEYVLEQSEWYNDPTDLTDMESGNAKYVVFDGVPDQFTTNPLPVDTNKLLRLYVINPGPDHFSSFHVVGAIFNTVEPSGSPLSALHGLQAWTLGPGDAAMFELHLPQPGDYPFVTHDMADMGKGAMGLFRAAPGATPGKLLPGFAAPTP